MFEKVSKDFFNHVVKGYISKTYMGVEEPKKLAQYFENKGLVCKVKKNSITVRLPKDVVSSLKIFK